MNYYKIAMAAMGAIILLQSIAMPGQAQTNNTLSAPNAHCVSQQIAAVALVVQAGNAVVCIDAPTSVGRIGDIITVQVSLSTPLLTGIPTTSVTYTDNNPELQGCTRLGTQDVKNNIAATGQAFTSTYARNFQITDTTCTDSIWVQATLGAVTNLVSVLVAFNTEVRDDITSIQQYGCSPTGGSQTTYSITGTICNNMQQINCNADNAASTSCDDPFSVVMDYLCNANSLSINTLALTTLCHQQVIDNKNRGCSASDWNTTCNPPTVNEVLTGQLAQLQYQCAATGGTPNAFNPATNTCTTPAMTVTNSGSQNIAITSWPTLVSTVTNSGTLNVVNSGGQTMTVSGSLTLAGGLTVTNAGGQSITVTSWPQLQAVLSGTVSNFNFACNSTNATVASYTTAQVCNTPFFKEQESGAITTTVGTQHLIIDSWPSLTTATTLTGTVNIQNTAGQTFALSGTVNTPITGALTVTNAGGQTISITSWPQLQAVLSGRVDVFAFQCGATHATPASYSSTTTTCQDQRNSLNINGTINSNQTNINQAGNIERLIANWFPMWFAITLIFIGIWRREAIQADCIAFAAILMYLAGGVCPFMPGLAGTMLRTFVEAVALWLTLLWAVLEMQSPETETNIEA